MPVVVLCPRVRGWATETVAVTAGSKPKALLEARVLGRLGYGRPIYYEYLLDIFSGGGLQRGP